MKKKNLKKLIFPLVLLVVLGGLIAGYIAIKNANENAQNEDAEPETEMIEVYDKGTAIITALSVTTEKNSFSFTYVNDDWVYDKDPKFPLKQDNVASMAAAVAKISAVAAVTDPSEDVSEYGLDKPAVKVVAKLSDNSEKTFLFGDENSFNSCQYFMMEGDDKVYMVEDTLTSVYFTDLDTLYKPESYRLQKDSVTDDDVTAITLNIGSKEKSITDLYGVMNLYELVYTLDLSQWEDHYADSEEMASTYGIRPEGDRITVSYTAKDESNTDVPKEYTIYIGASFESVSEESSDTTADSGDEDKEKSNVSYFYTYEGSSVVYSCDGETVEEIFTYLAYEPTTPESDAADTDGK